MKSFKTIFLSLLVLIFGGALLEGCLDVPVEPKGNVTGAVYELNGLPLPRTYVSVGDFPIAEADNNGNFAFDNISLPFSLVVNFSSENSKYLNLSSTNCLLNICDSGAFSSQTFVFATFPPHEKDRKVFIKFISSDEFHQYIPQIFPFGNFANNPDTVLDINIEMSANKNSIAGKFLYLEATVDISGEHILSYNKFGVKDFTLYPQELVELHFSPEDINNIPGQSALNFTDVLPGSLQNYLTRCYLIFNGMSHGSDVALDEYFFAKSGTFEVPLLSGMDINFKVINYYSNPPFAIGSKNGSKWMSVNGNGNVTIFQDDPIILAQPANMHTKISDTSTFQISDPGEKGIYFYTFFKDYNVFSQNIITIITDQSSIKFSEVKSRFVNFTPNTVYYWCVVKYPNYASINDFASVNFIEDNRYNSIPCSQTFTFTTAP